MKFIKYTECPVSINGEYFFASKASLGSSANIRPNRVEGGGLESYSPSSELTNLVRLDYYVTGSNDSVLALTGNMPASGSFGGIAFFGAYLTNYSINIEPYAPIQVSASFNVYSGLSGMLSADSFDHGPIDVANGAKTELLNIDSLSMGMDNPIEIGYSISCERSPDYVIGREFPPTVALGTINKKMSIKGENIGSVISYSGKASAAMSITPKSINNLARGQTMTCNGIITRQDLRVSNDGLVDGSMEIVESYR